MHDSQREAGTEIEITEAMIAVGVEVLVREDGNYRSWPESDRLLVEQIYLAMDAARSRGDKPKILVRKQGERVCELFDLRSHFDDSLLPPVLRFVEAGHLPVARALVVNA